MLEPVSWDEAIEAMIENFGRDQGEYGRDTLGVIGTGQLLTEEFYTLGKLVQLGFRIRNFDGNTTLCMASRGVRLQALLWLRRTAWLLRRYGDRRRHSADRRQYRRQPSDPVPAAGAQSFARQSRAASTTVIVVDPRVTKTAMMADIHLPVKPRSDIALLNGIAHVLIREGLIDRAYIDAHTTGFEEFIRLRRGVYPAARGRNHRTPPDDIVRTARLYGNAKAAFIGWTMGVNHSTQGAVTVAAINNLALITGNIGRTGASPFSITGQCNAMGTREAGFTSSLPGYRKFESATDRAELAGFGT